MRDDWRQAAIDGNSEVIEDLLAEDIDIDGRDRYGQTALMLAAVHGQDAVVRVLLEHGADMDVTAKHGLSALMLAVINRRTSIAEILVDAGANTKFRGSGAPGFTGKTASELAKNMGLDELAAYIVRTE